MSTPAAGSTRVKSGLGVLHLFCRIDPGVNRFGIIECVKAARGEETQVVTAALLGHKADIAFMVLDEDLWRLRDFQSGLAEAGLAVVDSYVSLTEISEYAAGMPEAHKRHRLYPELPPPDMPVWGFYPMSKRRGERHNWFSLPYERRKELMMEHGASGKRFAGRVLQVVTGSTGLDDFEWGVTLFCARPEDLKEVVYTLRFDEASALYGQFGMFYTGLSAPLEEILSRNLTPTPVTAKPPAEPDEPCRVPPRFIKDQPVTAKPPAEPDEPPVKPE